MDTHLLQLLRSAVSSNRFHYIQHNPDNMNLGLSATPHRPFSYSYQTISLLYPDISLLLNYTLAIHVDHCNMGIHLFQLLYPASYPGIHRHTYYNQNNIHLCLSKELHPPSSYSYQTIWPPHLGTSPLLNCILTILFCHCNMGIHLLQLLYPAI